MANLLRSLHDAAFAVLLRLPLSVELQVQPGLAGFFGEVFITLNGLRQAELYRKRAIVRWGPGSPYFEMKRGPNAWACFFQATEFDFSDARSGAALSLQYRPGGHDFISYGGLNTRQSVARALRAWCQPLPEISNAVDTFSMAHFRHGQMLGVHVRLTDVAAGAEGRQTVGLEQIMAAVDAWLAKKPDGGIYLASDDQRAIAAFGQRYTGRIAFQDCLRSQDGTSIHGHYDVGVSGSPYQKGREVLIDALLLARCNHLIRTHSRVTAFSLCWNLDLTYRDLEREILGIDRTPWLHEGCISPTEFERRFVR